MNARPSLASALLVGLALAGCVSAESADPNDARGATPAAPAQFDEETGAIEGIVTDAALNPIVGALVGLAQLPEVVQTTDTQGKFSFSRLPPADYQLFAQALGYESMARSVTIKAGEVTNVEVQLPDLPVVEPYQTLKIQKGLFGCGVSVRPVVGVSVCGVFSLFLNNTQYDHFLLEWKLDGLPEEWKMGVMEMEWQSTQAAGRALSINWEVDDCPNVRAQTFGRATGPSPIRILRNESVLDGVMGNATKNENCDDASENCDDTEKCEMMTRVFAAAELLGPSSPADVGFQFQQTFTQYEAEFYGEPGPADYTALGDG